MTRKVELSTEPARSTDSGVAPLLGERVPRPDSSSLRRPIHGYTRFGRGRFISSLAAFFRFTVLASPALPLLQREATAFRYLDERSYRSKLSSFLGSLSTYPP